MERVPVVRPWPALAGVLVLAAVVASALPHRQPPAMPDAVVSRPVLAPALAAAVGPGGLVGLSEDSLMSQLASADRTWIPRAEVLPDGRLRYLYKRRAGDPELSVDELRALIASPPSFFEERLAIDELLSDLRQVGVRIELSQPRKPGAAAEWAPGQRTIRIQPRVVAKGSREFAKVLNHEAIHVAQSCRRGHLHAEPQLLGLSRQVALRQRANLAAPIYAGQSPQQRRLEEEAYANQQHLSLGWQLLQAHCRH